MRSELAIQGIESIAQTGQIEPGLVLVAGNDDGDLPRLECAFALGRKIAGTYSSNSVALWSWQPSLALGEVQFVDASWRECHRWTLPLRALAEESELGTAWAGDYPDLFLAHDVADGLNGRGAPSARLLEGIGGRVVVLDFKNDLEFDELCGLNAAAKDCGAIVFSCAKLNDMQRNPYPLDSWAELALRVCVERGVNLDDVTIAIVAAHEGGWRCLWHEYALR